MEELINEIPAMFENIWKTFVANQFLKYPRISKI